MSSIAGCARAVHVPGSDGDPFNAQFEGTGADDASCGGVDDDVHGQGHPQPPRDTGAANVLASDGIRYPPGPPRQRREVAQYCPCSGSYSCWRPELEQCWSAYSCGWDEGVKVWGGYEGSLHCTCDDGTINVAGYCLAPEKQFEDVKPIKRVDNLLLLESKVVYDDFIAALNGGTTKGPSVKTATWAMLREYKDVFDFVFVVPYNHRGSSATHYSDTPVTTDGKLRANIYIDNYNCGGCAVPTMHEIGHHWNVRLSSLFGDKGPSGHWSLTGLDKHGQLGGYPKSALQCKSPDGRVPSLAKPCNDNTLKDLHYSLGSMFTSHDGIGAYAKLELVAMGLMTADELKGTEDYEAPHCSSPDYDPPTSAANPFYSSIKCEAGVNIITAKQVEDLALATDADNLANGVNGYRIKVGQELRAVVVVVMDGTTSGAVPTTVAGVDADTNLKFWNDYSKRMPGYWNAATYTRSTLRMDVSDADLGCGAKLACKATPAATTLDPSSVLALCNADCDKLPASSKVQGCHRIWPDREYASVCHVQCAMSREGRSGRKTDYGTEYCTTTTSKATTAACTKCAAKRARGNRKK